MARRQTFSNSAYQAFQSCEQKFEFRYVRGLRPHVNPIAPTKGIIFHEYLDKYYTALKAGSLPGEAHVNAAEQSIVAKEQEFLAAAQTAYTVGEEELAAQYAGVTAELTKLAINYYTERGAGDADRYIPLIVEKRLQTRLIPGMDDVGVVDLVTRENDTGAINLWEHKTTANVPSSSYRIRDFQTLKYSKVLEKEHDLHIDYVLWNYIRTKLPAIPHQNKPTRAGGEGAFSRAKDVDTTWAVYEAAVIAAGQSPAAYADVEERLRGREYTVFFPRYEHVIVATDLLVDDYVTTARRAYKAQKDWAAGRAHPVRTLTRDCDWCPYYRVCEAVLTGGDEADAIALKFTTRDGRHDIMNPGVTKSLPQVQTSAETVIASNTEPVLALSGGSYIDEDGDEVLW